jgi:excinuclease UvrABC helicase subunit UvrB
LVQGVVETIDTETGEIVSSQDVLPADPKAQQRLIETLRKEMFEFAARREYEKAAELRDRIARLQQLLLAS